jgi:hypothetical protein
MEEMKIEAQEMSMEKGEGKDIVMDTQMSEASKPSEAQRKRKEEKESGSKNNTKAHNKPMATSLMTDDVEMIAMTVEDRFSKVWENTKNHRASILEKIQEVKTTLEQLRSREEHQQQKTTTLTKEGASIGETV